MITAILHNIRSVHNVGSIFRTADGLGVEKLYLSGYTPEPIDRFGRKRNKFSKVSLGAEDTVGWESVDDVLSLINELQAEGVSVVACEPTSEAVDINNVSLPGDVCLVFGNEVDGIPEEVIDRCDQVVKVTMQGVKSSLNVSVSFGILVSVISKT
jgi:tRNA G18 (ribose-2'-O)-methylase SpoU